MLELPLADDVEASSVVDDPVAPVLLGLDPLLGAPEDVEPLGVLAVVSDDDPEPVGADGPEAPALLGLDPLADVVSLDAVVVVPDAGAVDEELPDDGESLPAADDSVVPEDAGARSVPAVEPADEPEPAVLDPLGVASDEVVPPDGEAPPAVDVVPVPPEPDPLVGALDDVEAPGAAVAELDEEPDPPALVALDPLAGADDAELPDDEAAEAP